MKKILLTTSALTLLAGAAVAEVNVGVTARLGISHVTSAGVTTTTTFNRMRINVSASGETDGGLTFGAFTRFQSGQGAFLGATGVMNGSNVWISNGTMTLTVGNTSGAVGNTAGVYGVGGCGFSADTSYLEYCANVIGRANTFPGYSSGGAGPNVVRLDFSLGSATISVSRNQSAAVGVANNEVAVSFALGSATIGIGHDDGGVIVAATPSGFSSIGGTYLNATMDLGSATVGLSYIQHNGAAAGNSWLVKAAMGVGSGRIGVFFANDSDDGMAADTRNRYGLNYSQSLGGGATAIVAVTNVAAFGAVAAVTTITAGMTLGF
ncbi:MAG: porin [Rhodobacteraceae bacterium]|nr:porin [Paracoccaceae bacterium]